MSRFESNLFLDEESKQTCFEPCVVARIESIPFLVGSKCLKECLTLENPCLFLDDPANDWCLDDETLYEPGDIYEFKSLEDGSCLDEGLCIDTPEVIPGCLDCIDLNKTTSKISESIRPDRGTASAISTFTLRIIDKDCHATKMISPNGYTDDLMGKRVDVFLDTCGRDDLSGLDDDWKKVFSGYICEICSGPGYIDIKICHPDSLKRRSIFEKCTGTLFQDYNPDLLLGMPIQPSPVCKVLVPGTGFRTLIKVGDDCFYEVVNSSVDYDLLGDFIGFDDILEGCPYLAGGGEICIVPLIEPATGLPYVLIELFGIAGNWYPIDSTTGLPVVNPDTGLLYLNYANQTGIGEQVFLPVVPFEGIERYCDNGAGGIKEQGEDFCAIYMLEGNPMDIALRLMLSCPDGRDNGSAYNVYGDGLCLDEQDVDIAAHEYIRDNVLIGVQACFFITNTIEDVRKFIEEQLYNPFGLSSTSKNSQASVNSQTTLFPGGRVITLNEDKIINCEKLKLRRSLNKFYFSEVVFKHTSNPCDNNQTFLGGTVSLDATAPDNFIRTNTLTICSEGMRDDKGGDTLANQTANRLLGRYAKGAEFIDGIEILFSCACEIQIGDLIRLDLTKLNVSDTSSFCRDTFDKFYEVYAKEINYKTGKAKINVLDSGISGDARLGLIAPAIKEPTYSGEIVTSDQASKFCVGECVRVRTNDCTTYSQEFTVLAQDGDTITLDAPIQAGLTDFLIEACDMTSMPDDYNEIFVSISGDGAPDGYGLG